MVCPLLPLPVATKISNVAKLKVWFHGETDLSIIPNIRSVLRRLAAHPAPLAGPGVTSL